jgi:hypothetical protein
MPRFSSRRLWRIVLLLVVAGGACADDPAEPHQPQTRSECMALAQFGDPDASPYCLPYAEGQQFVLGQSYCSEPSWSHHLRFAYDFLMPIGTEVLAARGGEVVELREHWTDEDTTGGHENMVSLRHADGTISIYMHFTHNGVAVDLGEIVPRGGLLGWSGSSGDTQGTPHLHFQICLRSGKCSWTTEEITLPVNFQNAIGSLDANRGLRAGESYAAGVCAPTSE